MTRKEWAIKIIKAECYVFNPLNLDRTQMVNTALDMAIRSLEAWEKVKTEIVERTKYLDEHDKEDMRELVGILSILASINEHLQEVTTDADCD